MRSTIPSSPSPMSLSNGTTGGVNGGGWVILFSAMSRSATQRMCPSSTAKWSSKTSSIASPCTSSASTNDSATADVPPACRARYARKPTPPGTAHGTDPLALAAQRHRPGHDQVERTRRLVLAQEDVAPLERDRAERRCELGDLVRRQRAKRRNRAETQDALGDLKLAHVMLLRLVRARAASRTLPISRSPRLSASGFASSRAARGTRARIDARARSRGTRRACASSYCDARGSRGWHPRT